MHRRSMATAVVTASWPELWHRCSSGSTYRRFARRVEVHQPETNVERTSAIFVSGRHGKLDARLGAAPAISGAQEQGATVVLDDLVGDGEAETRPLPLGLGGETWIGGTSGHLWRDAYTVVCDREGNAQSISPDRERDGARFIARVARVQKKVYQHLFEKARVAGNFRNRRCDVSFEPDARPLEAVLHELERRARERPGIAVRKCRLPPSSEGEEAPDHRRDALALLGDGLYGATGALVRLL